MTASSTHIGRSLTRLEYGKYCLSPDGPIQPGAEHQILGASEGFPTEWIERCSPTNFSLGVSPHEMSGESLLNGRTRYGVVLRPIRYRSQFSRLIYRLGIRSEGGTEQRRNYTVARYLFDEDASASPYQLYSALGKEIEGVVRDAPITPLPLPSIKSSLERHEYPLLLDGAITASMSAIAVVITSVNEDEFFRLAHFIWAHLPTRLRPLFSAGWNVSSVLVNSLCLNFCAQSEAPSVVYDVALRKWLRGPTVEYSSLAGWQYAKELLLANKLNCAELAEQLKRSSAYEVSDSLVSAEAKLPDRPGFDNAETRQFFCNFSDLNLSGRILELLHEWMNGAEHEMDAFLPLAAQRLARDQFIKNDLANLLNRISTHEAMQDRMNSLISALLQSKPRLFDDPVFDESPKLRFFSSLERSDARTAFESYAELINLNQASALPADAKSKFSELFGSAWGRSFLTTHSRLLGKDEFYNGEIAKQAKRAALEWTILDLAEIPAMLDRLAAISSQDSIEIFIVLIAFAKCQKPPINSAEILLSEFSVKDRERLVEVLEQRWRTELNKANLDSERCDRMARWFSEFPHQLLREPVFQAIIGFSPPRLSELKHLASRIDFSFAHFLKEKLSSRLLETLPQSFPEIIGSWKLFKPLVALWPEDVRIVFLRQLNPTTIEPDSCQIMGQFTPSAQALASIWPIWRAEADSDLKRKAINAIYRWSVDSIQADGSNHPFVRTIQIAVAGKWDSGTKLTRSASADASDLLSLISGRPNTAKQLWNSSHSYWQLAFVLYLFPSEVYEISLSHWRCLLRNRREAIEELNNSRISLGMRRNLAPLWYDFYHDEELVDRSLWKPEYIHTPLWAAFGQLPPDENGFCEGLDAYTNSDREKGECCSLFLKRHEATGLHERARRMVAVTFLANCLSPLRFEPTWVPFWKILSQGGKWKNHVTDISVSGTTKGGVRFRHPDRFIVESWMTSLLFHVAAQFGGFEPLKSCLEKTHPIQKASYPLT